MSQNLEITGTLIVKEETQSYGQSGFLKRKIVIETLDQYPQKIPIEFVQGKSDLPDPYNINEQVTVSYNLRGNEHNGNYYLSLQGWKIQRVPLTGGQAPPAQPELPNEPESPGPNDMKPSALATPLPAEQDDDVPF